MGRLQGRIAVVTGASSGMGQGAALKLAAEGAHVELLDRNEAGETLTPIRAAAGEGRGRHVADVLGGVHLEGREHHGLAFRALLLARAVALDDGRRPPGVWVEHPLDAQSAGTGVLGGGKAGVGEELRPDSCRIAGEILDRLPDLTPGGVRVLR